MSRSSSEVDVWRGALLADEDRQVPAARVDSAQGWPSPYPAREPSTRLPFHLRPHSRITEGPKGVLASYEAKR